MNKLLIEQVRQILSEEDKLAALCNLTALLYSETPNINWVGFYFHKKGKLILGPFQGKVACTQIDIGKGVCGTSFQNKLLLNVSDVHEFPGHIACDSASNSELVIPLTVNNVAVGVLDIDSPLFNRFELEEEETFLEVAKFVSEKLAA
ncbi:MAG: GAF domain-containing protein [Erysipelotrichaceae bacterium]|nr:GAF domain-containing protein [Erysipelotrichaceae bacterium]